MRATQSETPQVVFLNLFHVLDAMRRDALRKAPDLKFERMQGLTMRQAAAIAKVEILTREVPQGISLKTLAKHLQMTVPATSLMVEALVNKGLFERTPNPDDRRAVCIRLSKFGDDIMDKAREHITREIDKVLALMTPEEVDTLRGITDKIWGLYCDGAE